MKYQICDNKDHRPVYYQIDFRGERTQFCLACIDEALIHDRIDYFIEQCRFTEDGKPISKEDANNDN